MKSIACLILAVAIAVVVNCQELTPEQIEGIKAELKTRGFTTKFTNSTHLAGVSINGTNFVVPMPNAEKLSTRSFVS